MAGETKYLRRRAIASHEYRVPGAFLKMSSKQHTGAAESLFRDSYWELKR